MPFHIAVHPRPHQLEELHRVLLHLQYLLDVFLCVSSSGKTNHRNILSAWTSFRPLSNAPNERLSPRRSNNFLSARSPMHTIEQIQRSNTSASKLISKRPLPQFTVDGIVAGAIEFNPIKSAPLKNGQ
ncbi:hypothetical protein QR46_0563 [Giardia duodenalis assemblage B]|uniref:Uncharacterized protein n=1 Tax=Giardia duodenalis assemblage B TaxID=1394984 RepID=A0A132NZ81_GIAIN|nr:hypothetical protein QR46_0563 [Giardia intestinalis assemblage B]